MPTFYRVSPRKVSELAGKMGKFKIYEKDLVERFIRSKGKGGQKVNKTSSCVYLKHVPTGIEVKVSEERSQSLNRFKARRLLVKKIEEQVLGKESETQKKIEKLRRQKRKRSKRAKEKMLDAKHERSEKKASRRFVPLSDE